MEEINRTFLIIVVDDSLSYRNYISSKLETMPGISIIVLSAATKNYAFKLFKENPAVDLLVIDLDLDENAKRQSLESRLGIVLMKEIRKLNKKVGLIAFTGDGTNEAKRLCAKLKATHIKKYSLITPSRLLFSTIYEFLIKSNS
ncbi:hypothetical protein KXD93_25580 [Mucilaginibacter sp. BJC16-A38]|uniref:hypothetical protein n=1 Tax=Mucilaginibacter phenanthrenivorans TaxID=1234842 RepID=UPI002158541F|nr:hypothetical protein [Mucilaginibacter phenanthrenivorans]MCR8561054.1 hypothetical protein [Mucilaginibacter phenanthrenivorans]